MTEKQKALVAWMLHEAPSGCIYLKGPALRIAERLVVSGHVTREYEGGFVGAYFRLTPDGIIAAREAK